MSNILARLQRRHSIIHDILLKEWDPIGINDYPEAQDEYDSYTGEIDLLLIRKASERELFEHLRALEIEHMGSPGDIQKTESIAQRFFALRQEAGPAEWKY